MVDKRVLQAKQSSRSNRSRNADARSTSKRTHSPGNEKRAKSWLKNPGRSDLRGIDTAGAGRPPVSLKPSKMRNGKKRKSRILTTAELRAFNERGRVSIRPSEMVEPRKRKRTVSIKSVLSKKRKRINMRTIGI